MPGRTIFDVPSVRDHAIPRDRLLEKLGAGGRPSLVIVHGPAGSGKSTLLAQWAHRQTTEGVLLWITLHTDDAGRQPFWNRLRTALVAAELAHEHPLLAAAAEHGAGGGDPEPLLLRHRQTGTQALTLVLDDYHAIAGSEVDRHLRILLERDEKFRLVVGTRTATGLDSVELAARVGAATLDSSDLAFTLEESVTLAARDDPDAAPTHAHTIHEATQGWALATHALVVELHRQSPSGTMLDGLAEGRSRFIDELVRSARVSRSPEDYDAVLRIALADECTASLASELTGLSVDASRQVLARLERDGLVSRQWRADKEWFRLHPLLQEAFTADAVRRLDAATVRELRGVIFDSLEAQRPQRAMELAIAMSDWERLGSLIVRRWLLFAYYLRGPCNEMLASLPESALRIHPVLRAAQIAQDYGTRQASRNELLLRLATLDTDRRGRDVPQTVVGALTHIMFLGVHRIHGDMRAALALAETTESTLATITSHERHRHRAALAIIPLQTAITYMLDGQFERALDSAARAEALFTAVETLGERFQILAVTALIHASSGDLVRAREWTERCERDDPFDGWLGGYLQSGYDISTAILAINRWDAASAAHSLDRLAGWEPVIEYWPDIAIARAHVDLLLHGPAEAHSRLSATIARKRLRPPAAEAQQARLATTTARLLLLQGHGARAETALNQFTGTGYAEIDLLRARLAVLRGASDTALGLVGDLDWTIDGCPGPRADALLTLAIVSLEFGDEDRAARAFSDALICLADADLRLPLLWVPPTRVAATHRDMVAATRTGLPATWTQPRRDPHESGSLRAWLEPSVRRSYAPSTACLAGFGSRPG